ncbi:MAG TPA: PAS domain-containing protein [Ottowia sp.]|nr:PAS domain-containing protein [Ottowia sp.]
MSVQRGPFFGLPLPELRGVTGRGSVVAVSVFAVAALAAALTADTTFDCAMCGVLSAMLAGSALMCAHWVRRCAELETEQLQAAARAHRDTTRWLEAAELASLARFEWLPDGNRWWGDAALYRLLGLPASSLPTSTGLLQRYVDARDLERVQQHLQDAATSVGRLDCRFRVRRDDGCQRLVHARARVVRSEGAATRLVGVLADVTDATRDAEELRLARFALDAVDQPISALDDTLTYRLTNKAWFEVTGVSPRHQRDIHFDHVFPLITSPERRKAFVECERDRVERVVRGHNPAAPHSGQVVETRYIPFDDPQVAWRGIVMVSRRITDAPAKPAV